MRYTFEDAIKALNEVYEPADGYKEFINTFSSPEELMDWMNDNITYELSEDEYNDNSTVLTKTGEEVWETGCGHCAEQSYLEMDVLTNLGYTCTLIHCKENNTKQDYGIDGSAHIFVVFEDGDNYVYFEHAMEHARGIYYFSSMDDCFNYVADVWWRCNYQKDLDGSDSDEFLPADVLEFRCVNGPISGINNKKLADMCHKFPVAASIDISNNEFEPEV